MFSLLGKKRKSRATKTTKKPRTKKDKQPRTIKTKVVGVTFENSDGTKRQSILARCRKGEQLVLKRSPVSGYPHAIAVCKKSGKQLGYISDQLARDISNAISSGQKVTCKILNLTGGGLFGKKIRGCNIEIRIGPNNQMS